jgi:hypothetical protein
MFDETKRLNTEEKSGKHRHIVRGPPVGKKNNQSGLKSFPPVTFELLELNEFTVLCTDLEWFICFLLPLWLFRKQKDTKFVTNLAEFLDNDEICIKSVVRIGKKKTSNKVDVSDDMLNGYHVKY